jgi:hypothetical protein
MRTFLLTLTAAAAAVASDPAARLSSPVLGYVFDPGAKAVRPIAGIPGAASVESPLPSASKLANGFVSQNGEWLLAILLDGGATVTNLKTGTTQPLEGAPEGVTLGAWSSDSASVAIWSKSGILQVWSGLSGSPAVVFSQPVEHAAGIAVAAGGSTALIWNDSGLFTADNNGVQQVLAEPVRSAALRPGSSEWAAIVGTRLIRPGVEPMALNVENATSVAFISTGLLVAGRAGVEAISESGASLTRCECEATALEAMAGTNVFRLTGVDSPMLAIFDGNEAEARILYIPNAGGRQ